MADDINRDSSEKRFKGSAREIEGKVRGKIGGLTGDKSEQVKGKAEEFRGKVERKIGEAESDLAED
jgi:uncharacterized protein YjbJ (UPF0337 family)